LQPNVSCREGYGDVGPWQVKVLAGKDVRHTSGVVLALPLCLVHRLIGSAGDCIDDVDHAHHSRAARVRGLLLWWRWRWRLGVGIVCLMVGGRVRPRRHCWWRSGPKGGRRHNSPQSSLTPLAYYHEGRYFYLRKEGRCRKLNNTKRKQENTQQTEDRKNCCRLRYSLLITVCPFHYKGFTIYRRPLGIVICHNYTFSVPDKRL
jgi:hypothetical protein